MSFEDGRRGRFVPDWIGIRTTSEWMNWLLLKIRYTPAMRGAQDRSDARGVLALVGSALVAAGGICREPQ